MYKLIIEDDEGKTTVVPLIRDEITIGRKEGNTIRLTERNVSRRHAKLSKGNGAIYIEDLQSYNGIRVNGDRIAGRAPITEGDRIQIGDYQLALKLDKGPSADDDETADTKPTPIVKDERPPDASARSGAAPSAAAAPSTEATPEKPAKLVVVSSNFAGREFKLDKAQCVIGRTEENDVVINHRSISRHHAKIVHEQGRYQVVDLGSANGVRVNGEDYGKVELRRGDLIDLGHVRLRFVAPGEDFVFARDAHVVDVATADNKGPLKLVAAAAAGVVLAGVIAMVALKERGGDAPKAGADSAAQVARINLEVDRCAASADWDCAIAQATRGLALDANNGTLREKKTKADSEKKNQGVYEQYSRAAKAGDNDAAVMRYQEIPDGSLYQGKAQETWQVIRGAYVSEHLAKARDLVAAARCDEAKKHVEAVLLVDETNGAATDIAARCGQAQAAARGPRAEHGTSPRPERLPPLKPDRIAAAPKPEPPKPEPPKEEPPKPEPPPKSTGAGGGDAVLVDAQDRYVHGDYQGAIDKARKALRDDPSNAKAWRLIGASHCFLKDKPGATSAWNKLGNIERQFLKYVCQRNGITLP